MQILRSGTDDFKIIFFSQVFGEKMACKILIISSSIFFAENRDHNMDHRNYKASVAKKLFHRRENLFKKLASVTLAYFKLSSLLQLRLDVLLAGGVIRLSLLRVLLHTGKKSKEGCQRSNAIIPTIGDLIRLGT
jgi:hypothetical protein